MHHNSVKANCGWCEKEFQTYGRSQLIAIGRGYNVYCSPECHRAFYNRKQAESKPHLLGPCPQCNNMFRSRTKDKIFCSIKCYLSSDECHERLIAINPGLKPGVRLPATNCIRCGTEINNRNYIRKFCSKNCRRLHYAERFDRWVANPETLALPQCYDEFLMQEELPCLIDGCEWVGKHLSTHCNVVHGIRAEDLKKLAGFNNRTGLVTPDISAMISERMHREIAEGKITPGSSPEALRSGMASHGPPSLEATEHMVKGWAIARATADPKPDTICPICGKPVKQGLTGKQIYCSTKCRSIEYSRRSQGQAEMTCAYCGSKFMGNKPQVLRVRRGQKVCCSKQCRNQMNMIACLTVQGRRLPAFPEGDKYGQEGDDRGQG